MNDDVNQDPVDMADDPNDGRGGQLPEDDIPDENIFSDAPPRNEPPDGM